MGYTFPGKESSWGQLESTGTGPVASNMPTGFISEIGILESSGIQLNLADQLGSTGNNWYQLRPVVVNWY